MAVRVPERLTTSAKWWPLASAYTHHIAPSKPDYAAGMVFADLVLARGIIAHLDERQIDLVFDALEEHSVVVDERDRAAIDAFVREILCELGPVPAATEVEVTFGVGRYASLN